MQKRILITGGSGLLGQYLNIELGAKYAILSLYNSQPGNCLNFNSRMGDLTDEIFLQDVFNSFNPDVVVHTAAVSNPQRALAADPDYVYRMNVTVTERIASLCRNTGALLIYTSTDLVYAGYRGSILKENAKLAPKSLYAETKLMGEVKIQRIAPRFLILRTALLLGNGMLHTTCSFEQMVIQLAQGKNVQVFTDQFRSPLFLVEAARIIGFLIAKEVEGIILNFGGSERLSRAEIGEMVCTFGGFDIGLLNKITMDTDPSIVPVEDVSLNVSGLLEKGVIFQPFQDLLQSAVHAIIEKAG